ncbi:uncharacterized protein LOC109864121 [Pseudomyrmex gracilis]|uniref:uncharacterized protein LOC109864121 n=1 Tax=Pseudomyrmex gracilis TaxID=219809 RepID=UPI000995931C|nr:uncharacterized protein LOC109864121 [Pseudomyrmex gracilis]
MKNKSARGYSCEFVRFNYIKITCTFYAGQRLPITIGNKNVTRIIIRGLKTHNLIFNNSLKFSSVILTPYTIEHKYYLHSSQFCVMFRQKKIKSRDKASKNRSKNSIKSDNLSLSISSDTSTKCSTGKSKRAFSTILPAESHRPRVVSEEAQLDAAVHFGKFYEVQSNNAEKLYCDQRNDPADGLRTRRSEFTRQMVHKLERITDAKDYARQVSILLKETVEPPNFKLNSLLSENSIPDRRCSDYPLWYKEPHEAPLAFSNPNAQLDAREI